MLPSLRLFFGGFPASHIGQVADLVYLQYRANSGNSSERNYCERRATWRHVSLPLLAWEIAASPVVTASAKSTYAIDRTKIACIKYHKHHYPAHI